MYKIINVVVTVCLTCLTSVTTICSSSQAQIPLKEYTGGIRSHFALSKLYSLRFRHQKRLAARCSSNIHNRKQRTSDHN